MITKLVMGVVGVVVLSAIFEIVMPDGAFKKYVKGSVSAVFVLIVLSSVNFKEIDVSSLFFTNGEQIEVDEGYVDYVEGLKTRELEKKCEAKLETYGYSKVSVEICLDSEKKVQSVYANLSRMVLTSDKSNINITMEIRTVLAEYLSVDLQKVRADESQG